MQCTVGSLTLGNKAHDASVILRYVVDSVGNATLPRNTVCRI